MHKGRTHGVRAVVALTMLLGLGVAAEPSVSAERDPGAAPAESAHSVPGVRIIARLRGELANTPAVRIRLRDRRVTSSSASVSRDGVAWRSSDPAVSDVRGLVVSRWSEVRTIEVSTRPAPRGARRGAIAGAVVGAGAGVGLQFLLALAGEDEGSAAASLLFVIVPASIGALAGAGVGWALDPATGAKPAPLDDPDAWRLVWTAE